MTVKIEKEKLELWADYLLKHSLGGISKEDIVMIKGEHVCWPLISVLQDKIFAAGARADVNIVAPDNNRGKVWGASAAKFSTVEKIMQVPEWMVQRYATMTKYIEILGAEDTSLFEGVNEELDQAVMKADEQIKNIRLSKRWVLTLFPTKGFAEMEGMDLEEYTKVIVNASTVNPKYLEEIEEDIYQLLTNGKEVKIETVNPKSGEEYTLAMNIEGRNARKCTGLRNFPDGEVFTSPNTSTTEGEIFVDLPVFQGGATIEGIYLKFEKGKIVKYNAEKGLDTLKKIIETDEGSHRLGEVALGMNNAIERVFKHPLFVEKVGGTLHIAIGASYPECYYSADNPEKETLRENFIKEGKLNVSAQHVDIVTDFRPGGAGKAVYIDNIKLEIKDNIWIVPKN